MPPNIVTPLFSFLLLVLALTLLLLLAPPLFAR